MPTTVTVMERSSTGQTTRETVLELLTEHVSVRELIRARVLQELRHRLRRDANARSHGAAAPPGSAGDPEAECDQALDAFARGQILVFLDDRQLETLDETIVVRPATRLSFLKLVPLVGG